MIRPARSPDTTAAATKSFERMDRAWERNTRAEPAQPVTTSTKITVPKPGGRKAARMTRSGSPGQQEDIGDQGQCFVNELAEVRRRQAHQDADEGGCEAHSQPDEQ